MTIEEKIELRRRVKHEIADAVTWFLYLDRESDPQLSEGKIQAAVKEGILSIEDMVEWFSEELHVNIPG